MSPEHRGARRRAGLTLFAGQRAGRVQVPMAAIRRFSWRRRAFHAAPYSRHRSGAADDRAGCASQGRTRRTEHFVPPSTGPSLATASSKTATRIITSVPTRWGVFQQNRPEAALSRWCRNRLFSVVGRSGSGCVWSHLSEAKPAKTLSFGGFNQARRKFLSNFPSTASINWRCILVASALTKVLRYAGVDCE